VAVRSHMEVVIDHTLVAAIHTLVVTIHMLVAAIHMLVAAIHMPVAADHMLVAIDQIQVKQVGSHRPFHLHHNRQGPFVVVQKQLDLNLVGRFEEAFIQGIELDIQVEPVADQLVLHKVEVLNLEGIKVEDNLELGLRCCDDYLKICLKAKARYDFQQ